MAWDPEYLAAIEREQQRLIAEGIARARQGIEEGARAAVRLEHLRAIASRLAREPQLAAVFAQELARIEQQFSSVSDDEPRGAHGLDLAHR